MRTRLYVDPRTGLVTSYNPRVKGDGSKAKGKR